MKLFARFVLPGDDDEVKNTKCEIYAVTPNPTLDLSGHVATIRANEKNTVSRVRTDPGGNAINAARIASRLGSKPILMGFLGGAAGKALNTLLAEEGLDAYFTPIVGNTRTNVTVTNDHDGRQTRLSFPGPDIKKAEVASLQKAIRKLKAPGIILFGGSLPQKCPKNFYPSLIRLAQSGGLGAIVDVPSNDLRVILKSRMDRLLCIKPNLAEFEELTGTKLKTDGEIATAARKLLPRCALICVSLGKRGVLFAWNGRTWQAKPPAVKARGSVGAGDSMLGAIAHGLAKAGLASTALLEQASEATVLSIIRAGVAAGSATVMTEGTTLGEASVIRSLSKRVKIVPIKSPKEK